MAIAILTIPPFPGATGEDEDRNVILRDDGPGLERVALTLCSRRIYSWPRVGYVEDEAQLHAFYVARGGSRDPFFLQDPWFSQRVNVSIGTGTGAATVFGLPTLEALDEYRGFAIPGTITAAVAGVGKAIASADLEARTITLAAAPANGAAVTASYFEYRLCRFERVQWTGEDVGIVRSAIQIREVFRSL